MQQHEKHHQTTSTHLPPLPPHQPRPPTQLSPHPAAYYQPHQYSIQQTIHPQPPIHTISSNMDITHQLLYKLQNKHSEHFRQYMDKKKVFMSHKFKHLPSKNKNKPIESSSIKAIFVPKLKQFTDLSHEQYLRSKPSKANVKQLFTGIQQEQEYIKVGQGQNMQSLREDNFDANKMTINRRFTDRHTNVPFTQSNQYQSKYYKQPYYQYIQNYENSKGDIRSKKQRKLATQPDQLHDNSSLSLNKSNLQKHTSTIFHKCKLKLNASVIINNQKEKSLSSIINISVLPTTEAQQQQFLLKYVPLNTKFNIKDLIKQENFQVITQTDHVYFGETNVKGKHGIGILLSGKSIFQGIFNHNQKHKGFSKHTQGIYEGYFKNNKRHGQGIFTWKNGQTYEGEWKNGEKSGHGIWRSPNGNFYEGEWKQNKLNGKGFYDYSGKSKYRGYFKDFLKHGRGEQDFINGDKYIGTYQNGKPHGYGKYVFSNGDIYEGQFIQGSRQGKGTLIKVQGNTYEGHFLQDMKHGQGIERSKEGYYFEGQFQQNQRYSGTIYSKNREILQNI